MSLTASRPPGFSTRAISRKTAVLSGARLITQLLMMQSTDASASGRLSIVAWWNSTLVAPERAALRRYRGPLLTGSEVPAIVEARRRIDEGVHAGVTAS